MRILLLTEQLATINSNITKAVIELLGVFDKNIQTRNTHVEQSPTGVVYTFANIGLFGVDYTFIINHNDKVFKLEITSNGTSKLKTQKRKLPEILAEIEQFIDAKRFEANTNELEGDPDEEDYSNSI